MRIISKKIFFSQFARFSDISLAFPVSTMKSHHTIFRQINAPCALTYTLQRVASSTIAEKMPFSRKSALFSHNCRNKEKKGNIVEIMRLTGGHGRGWKFPRSSQISPYISRVESGMNMETANPRETV